MQTNPTFKLWLYHVLLVSIINQYSGCPCKSVQTSHGVVTNCSARGLPRVPENLDNETNILDLSQNNITVIPDKAFAEINDLLKLYLQENSIETLEPGAFSGLENLRILDVSQNNLQYTDNVFYGSLFAPLKNLSGLYLHGNNKWRNRAKYPDKAIGACQNLQFLKIDGVYAKQFGEGFANLTKLTNLTVSCLSHNTKVGRLYNNTFQNLVHLQYLAISNCSLTFIDGGSFSSLHKLLYLDVSNNPSAKPGGLNLIRNISHGLQNTTATFLNISRMVWPRSLSKYITIQTVEFLRNTTLKEIDASGNNIEMLDVKAMKYLPETLEVLDVSDNRFILSAYIYNISVLKNIKIIKADKLNYYHKNRRYPRSQDLTKIERPRAESFDRSSKADEYWGCPDIPLPPKLEDVSCGLSGLNFRIPCVSLPKNNSVTKIDLHQNLIHTWSGPLYLGKLKYLDLSSNYCDNVSDKFFTGMPELETLKLGRNFIGDNLKDDVDGKIFRPLNKLKFLDLHRNSINSLPKKCFRGLSSLESLDISDNGLEMLEVDISHMKNLAFLDLSDNYIITLPKDVRSNLSEFAMHRHVSVNLADNNLECTCGNLDFLEWFEASNIHFVYRANYTCLNSARDDIRMNNIKGLIYELQNKCASYSVLITICSVLLGLFLLLFVYGILYRYRWKLRYLYYMTWGRYSLIKETTDVHYTYDAFVSYASENEDFVKNNLLPNLEENFGLRLCIHDRDFTPGKEIAANIVNAIQNSRKIVFLLSPAFLQSYWCMFEFNMTRMEKIYLRGSEEIMFVIMLESLYTHTLPVEVLDLIQSHSYIEYPNDAQGNVVFWGKVKQAIKS